ncbi:ABC transporter permease [Legionella geestiana]|uniref:ABC transporter permease n=1 Tax=Legionella geestiana TaxID=45065 RepID=UPI0004917DD3|nr:ABC transporter permease [Legionella geestiana]
MSHHFLLTDWCLLTVMALGLLWFGYSLRKAPAREVCRRLFQKPIAASAAVVVFAFMLIGVLDSIPARLPGKATPSSQTATVLDRLFYPVGQYSEKTYSSPLALTLFTPEVIVVDGRAQQVKPRLQFPPAFLETPADVERVVWRAAGFGASAGLLVSGILWFLTSALGPRRSPARSFVPTPGMRAAILTIACLVAVVVATYTLSRVLHVLGTGKVGEDIFYQSVKSIRTGLAIGLLTTLFMLPLALFLGAAAGFFGGVVDDAIQYIYTTLSSIPGVLLISASVLSLQTWITNHPEQFPTLADSADARLLALCLILGMTSWTGLCRLLRAETLKLREMDYVLAARALGSSSLTIMRRHLLPNVLHIVLITLVLDFSFLVLAEAVLSYVGVGVSPMTISWGNMINSARLELSREPVVWWPMFAAFIMMFALVLACNLFADAVRDTLDPRNSSAQGNALK